MTYFEDVITMANIGGHAGVEARRITCADGFSMSVIAGGGAYSTPRPAICSRRVPGMCPGTRLPMLNQVECSYTGPFTEVEVGFPSQRPEPWADLWRGYADGPGDPTETVYGYVPVQMVRDLIDLHGGEKP